MPGEVVVTDLYNTATPLIRYRLGDFATLDSRECPCGRKLPLLKGIHGRAYDLIASPSGRSIHPESLIYVFENLQSKTLAFKQFQAEQISLNKIIIRLVPTSLFSAEIAEMILSRLRADVDPKIEFEILISETLNRERSGKMRLVKGLPPLNN
jgi:phenylacetate-CoA ligase